MGNFESKWIQVQCSTFFQWNPRLLLQTLQYVSMTSIKFAIRSFLYRIVVSPFRDLRTPIVMNHDRCNAIFNVFINHVSSILENHVFVIFQVLLWIALSVKTKDNILKNGPALIDSLTSKLRSVAFFGNVERFKNSFLLQKAVSKPVDSHKVRRVWVVFRPAKVP